MKKPSQMSPEEKEAFHREAESRIRVFKYEQPPNSGKPKDVAWLSKSPLLNLIVQVVHDGGENNLHYHTNSETVWMVMRGRTRFYGPNDVVLGEIGEKEAIYMPGGARYWFEKVGAEDLELLQIMAVDRAGEAERINVDAHKNWMNDDKFLQVYEEAGAR
jgi:mannose-6-phosphate isomerase-like protein (cupin superfamily)